MDFETPTAIAKTASAGIGALRELVNLTKSVAGFFKGRRVDPEMAARVEMLERQSHVAMQEFVALIEKHHAVCQRLEAALAAQELAEREVVKLRQFDIDAKGYLLTAQLDGTVSRTFFAKAAGVDPGLHPPHHLCPTCFDRKVRTYLCAEPPQFGVTVHSCPACGFKMRAANDIKANILTSGARANKLDGYL